MLIPDSLTNQLDFIALWHGWIDHPDEPSRLLILADFCEDNSCDADARLYRWMQRHDKRPANRGKYPNGRKVNCLFAWAWWCAIAHLPTEAELHRKAILPRAVFVCLDVAERWMAPNGDHVYYPTETAALASLRHALTVGVEVFAV